MSRPPRICFIGGVYHVTTRCNNKEFHFKNDSDFDLYLTYMGKAREKYELEIYGYCVTHNHVHLVLGTPKNKKLSKFMQYLNGQFAKAYNRKYKKTGHFWGERFASNVIESESQFLNTLLYSELNMVRCGVATTPKEWKHSSYNQHAHGKGNFNVDLHENYLQLGDNNTEREVNYQEIMKEYIEKKGLLKKQVAITTGIIYGSKQFVEEIMEKHNDISYYNGRKIYKSYSDIYCLKKPKILIE